MAVGRLPAGMIFVRGRGGIGHSPDEQTPPEHCNHGAQVVADALMLPTAS
jgi:acetylornithine deacetylase/succinyl-diaminopimelate desuccinylase-like protein